jgi:hopanoid-associated phosphorylase
MPCKKVVTIGVIVGMRSEASLLAPGIPVGCSGGRPQEAARIARALLDEGADGLLSFGLAGGLLAGMAAGALVIASAVDLGGASLATDPTWSLRLANSLPTARRGVVCGVVKPALTPSDKAALRGESGGLAADMESGAVAETCAGAGKPFAVLRAVADPAERAIPAFALAGLGVDGGTLLWPVLFGLLRQPRSLPALLGLARDSSKALASLGAAARLLGPTLAF